MRPTFIRDEQGSVSVIAAVALPVMIEFAELAADVPHLYQNQQRLQTIADAAADVGAMALALAAANSPAGYGPITV